MQELIEQGKVAPEELEVLNTYLRYTDIELTARELDLPKDKVVAILNKREVKKVVDTIFLEQGYLNRFRMRDILDSIVEQKLEEAKETGMYTSKDLLDVLQFMHKISIDERKLEVSRDAKPTNQTNVQINEYGQNYGNLLERILAGNNVLPGSE